MLCTHHLLFLVLLLRLAFWSRYDKISDSSSSNEEESKFILQLGPSASLFWTWVQCVCIGRRAMCMLAQRITQFRDAARRLLLAASVCLDPAAPAA